MRYFTSVKWQKLSLVMQNIDVNSDQWELAYTACRVRQVDISASSLAIANKLENAHL
jgi:hypothetical protein